MDGPPGDEEIPADSSASLFLEENVYKDHNMRILQALGMVDGDGQPKQKKPKVPKRKKKQIDPSMLR